MAVKSTRGSAGRGTGTKAAARPSAKPAAANALKVKAKPTKVERAPAPAAAKAAPRPPALAPAPRLKRGGNGAIRVGIAGCAGRMGQMLLKLLITAPGVLVVGGTERRGSHVLGRDLGALAGGEPLGITIGDNPEPLFEQSDVVGEGTSP